jgi:hypothetical protein
MYKNDVTFVSSNVWKVIFDSDVKLKQINQILNYVSLTILPTHSALCKCNGRTEKTPPQKLARPSYSSTIHMTGTHTHTHARTHTHTHTHTRTRTHLQCVEVYALYAGRRKEGATYCNVKVQGSGGTDGWKESLLVYKLSQYSVWLRAGQPGDRGSIPGGGKGFFLYPLCPDRLWGPPSLLYNGYRGSFPRG